MINNCPINDNLPEDEVLKIRTGRTTALALRAIAESLENPETPVKLMDHDESYGEFNSTTVMACRVNHIISVLCLQRMSITDDVPHLLTFSPYTKTDKD